MDTTMLTALFRCVLLAASLATAMALPVSAQTSVHGAVSGRVLDPSAAIVVGASVTLTHEDTSTSQSTTTGADGRYTFPRVIPGQHYLVVEHQGFRPARQDAIVVRVNDTAVVDVTLAVGGAQETVSVVGTGAAVVQTGDASVSLVVDEARVRELPLNAKDFQRLIYLAPGVAGGSLINPSTSGTRGSSNNFVIDGISANEEREAAGLPPPGNSAGDPLPNIISTEAIQEFRVITSNADASFGRGAGAQVNVITKSGGNVLRGSAYEYFRNDRFDSPDFFNQGPFFDSDGNPKPPPFRQHLFGGTAGGPLARDKHFFFVSYEGFRQKLEQTASPVLPNAALLDLVPGDLGRFLRGYFYDLDIVPRTGNPAGDFEALSPEERSAASAAGFPTHLFDGNPANQEAGVVVNSRASTRDYDHDALLLRSDHRLSSRTSVSARYTHTGAESRSRYLGMPGTLYTQPRQFRSGSGELLRTLAQNQMLEVRAGVQWAHWHLENEEVPGVLAPARVDGVYPIVLGTTSFYNPFLDPAVLFESTQTVPQVSVQHTWDRGRYVVRSGADVRDIRLTFANHGFVTPEYYFDGLVGQTGLLGAGPNQTVSVADFALQTRFDLGTGPGNALRDYHSTVQDYFVQTDWRVRDDVTVNAGLRYSFFGPYQVEDTANFYAIDAAGNPLEGESPFVNGRTANRLAVVSEELALYKSDRNNFQPRIGVAWNIGGRETTVVRAAWGVYHDGLFQFAFNNLVNNAPFAVSGTAVGVPFRIGERVPINPDTPAVFGIDPSISSPYFHRVNLSVERRLGEHSSVTASYVGSRGRDLARITDENFAGSFPQARRPDIRFTTQRFLTSAGTSAYDALQVYLDRRLAGGMSLTVAYTLADFKDVQNPDTIGFGSTFFATLIDTGATAASGIQVGAFAPRPVEADYGTSNVAVRHNFVASHVIELPFGAGRRFLADARGMAEALLGGWSLAGILRARSGNAIDVRLGQDVNDDGANNDRPALISGELSDLYNSGGGSNTQYLIPQNEARRILGTPADVTDPFAVIPRNALHGPTLWSYDLSIAKRASIGQRYRVQIEANVFNLFNRVNLNVPNASLSSALFGRVTSTAPGFGPRQMQFGAKFMF